MPSARRSRPDHQRLAVARAGALSASEATASAEAKAEGTAIAAEAVVVGSEASAGRPTTLAGDSGEKSCSFPLKEAPRMSRPDLPPFSFRGLDARWDEDCPLAFALG